MEFFKPKSTEKDAGHDTTNDSGVSRRKFLTGVVATGAAMATGPVEAKSKSSTGEMPPGYDKLVNAAIELRLKDVLDSITPEKAFAVLDKVHEEDVGIFEALRDHHDPGNITYLGELYKKFDPESLTYVQPYPEIQERMIAMLNAWRKQKGMPENAN